MLLQHAREIGAWLRKESRERQGIVGGLLQKRLRLSDLIACSPKANASVSPKPYKAQMAN